MLSRYTERAQKAMNLALEEARRLGWDTVDTAQLFLGLIREGNGLAAVVLQNLGLNLDEVRSEVERMVGRRPGVASRELEFTPRAIRVLTEESVAVSRDLRHNYVGTEHILLALLKDTESTTALALGALGVSPADVRSLILASVPAGEPLVMTSVGPRPAGDQVLSQVLALAAEEARSLGSYRLDTEHLLLGIVRSGAGKAPGILARKGVTWEWLRSELLHPSP